MHGLRRVKNNKMVNYIGKKIWVRITSSNSTTAWYADKIGSLHLVYVDFYPQQYMVAYKPHRRLYNVIDKTNAEEAVPSFKEKMQYYISNMCTPFTFRAAA